MTFALTMGNVNNKLSEKYSWQQDGAFLKQEEMRITNYAKTYAYCEHSLVVVSNLRTNKSHIFVGMTGEMLGIGRVGDYQCIDSCWKEEIFACVHPEDRAMRDLQELSFFSMMSTPSNITEGFPWYMETVMRMMMPNGSYRNVSYRIHYSPSRQSQIQTYGNVLTTDFRMTTPLYFR